MALSEATETRPNSLPIRSLRAFPTLPRSTASYVCEDLWLTQLPRVQPEYILVDIDERVRIGLDFGFGRQTDRGAERKVQRVGDDDPGRGAVDFVDVGGKAFAIVFQQLRVTDLLLGMGLLRAARSRPSWLRSKKQMWLYIDEGIGSLE